MTESLNAPLRDTINNLARELADDAQRRGYFDEHLHALKSVENDEQRAAVVANRVYDALDHIGAELCEAYQGCSTGDADKHLPGHTNLLIELADIIMIPLGLAGLMGWDIGSAMVDKQEFNKTRPHHKEEKSP